MASRTKTRYGSKHKEDSVTAHTSIYIKDCGWNTYDEITKIYCWGQVGEYGIGSGDFKYYLTTADDASKDGYHSTYPSGDGTITVNGGINTHYNKNGDLTTVEWTITSLPDSVKYAPKTTSFKVQWLGKSTFKRKWCFFENHYITCYYESPEVYITVEKTTGCESVSGTGQQVEIGGVVSISATPKPGYTFTKWNDENTSASRTYTVVDADTYQAGLNYKTFTPIMTPNSYTLTFNANGGTTSTTNKTITFDSKYGSLPTPTRSGYTFNGWYTAATGGTKITTDSVVNTTSNHTLYAQWIAIPDIGYDNLFSLSNWANSASGILNGAANSNDSMVIDNVNGTIRIKEGDSSDIDVYTQYGNGGSHYNIPIAATDSEGKPIKYYIKMHMNQNTSGSLGQFFVFYYTATGNASTSHTGWRSNTLNSTGDFTFEFTPPSNCTKIGLRFGTYSNLADVTFSNIRIYKETNIYKNFISKITNYKSRDLKTLSSLYSPSQTGYNFNGWYKNESLSGSVLTLAEAQAITSGITVYSKWTAKTPTVTFDAQGGSVNPSTQSVTYGNSYGSLPTPTRTGHNFNGWKYQNNFITSSTIVITETNHTLTADWSANQYTVTFISDGNVVSTTNIEYGDKYSNFPTVNKEGYVFNGWKNTNGATITSNSNMLVAENHSLTAEWLPFSYTIIFNGNGDDGTGAMTQQTFKYQQNQQLTKNTFSKSNHKFIGWNTAIDGTGDSFSDEHQMKDFKPSSDGQIITLYAQWLFAAMQNIKIDDLKVVEALLDTTKIIKIFVDKILVYGS